MFKKIKNFLLFDEEDEYAEKLEEIKLSEIKPIIEKEIKKEIIVEKPIILEKEEIAKEKKKILDKKTTMYEYTDKETDKFTKVKIVEESKNIEFKPSIFISPIHGASTDDTLKMREKKQEVSMKTTMAKSKTTKSLDDIYKKVKGLKDPEPEINEIIEETIEMDQKSLFDYLEEDVKK